MICLFCHRAVTIIQVLTLSLAGLASSLPTVLAQTNPPVSADATAPTGLPLQQQTAAPIPFTIIPGQGTPLVHVVLNGHIDATFMVDTGSNNCAVSEELAKKLGVVPHPAVDGTQPYLLNGKQAQAIDLTSLQIGDILTKNPVLIQPFVTPMIVLSDKQLGKVAAISVDGIIGANGLSYFAVGFDFHRHVMMFYYPGILSVSQVHYAGFNIPADVPTSMSSAATDYKYFVSVEIAKGGVSRQVDLLLDTGAKNTFVSRDVAEALSLTPTQRQPTMSLSRRFDTDIAPVSSLRVGGVTVKDFLVYFPHTGDYATVLGLDFLSSYYVLMDFPAQKMYVAPSVTVAPGVHIGPAAQVQPPTALKQP